jgi:hypothetical protein
MWGGLFARHGGGTSLTGQPGRAAGAVRTLKAEALVCDCLLGQGLDSVKGSRWPACPTPARLPWCSPAWPACLQGQRAGVPQRQHPGGAPPPQALCPLPARDAAAGQGGGVCVCLPAARHSADCERRGARLPPAHHLRPGAAARQGQPPAGGRGRAGHGRRGRVGWACADPPLAAAVTLPHGLPVVLWSAHPLLLTSLHCADAALPPSRPPLPSPPLCSCCVRANGTSTASCAAACWSTWVGGWLFDCCLTAV